MIVRWKTAVILSGFCLIPIVVKAAEICASEYQPMSGRYLISVEEAASLKLSPQERSMVVSTWQEYGERTAVLHRDFELQKAELIARLEELPASREKADIVAVNILSTEEELARKNVDWQRALTLNISVGRMSSLATAHQKGRKRSPRHLCGPLVSRIGIPLLRYDLSGREKVLIGLTEEEQANVDQFIKRNIRLREEYRSLAIRLDRELLQREPGNEKLEDLLRLLALNTRQDAINALDCYFYGEANIFTPERMAKLRKYWDKRKKKK